MINCYTDSSGSLVINQVARSITVHVNESIQVLATLFLFVTRINLEIVLSDILFYTVLARKSAIRDLENYFSEFMGGVNIFKGFQFSKCRHGTTYVFISSKNTSTRMGFEPTRGYPNGLAVHRLNHF